MLRSTVTTVHLLILENKVNSIYIYIYIYKERERERQRERDREREKERLESVVTS